MDLQAATDSVDIEKGDSAVVIVKRNHEALRGAFVDYRRQMEDGTDTRSALAQDICMQLELHMTTAEKILYPALEPCAAPRVEQLLKAQEDLQECVNSLRRVEAGDPEIDSTMTRLMQIADCYIHAERELLAVARDRIPDQLSALGAQMVAQRERIAGAVQDLEGRS